MRLVPDHSDPQANPEGPNAGGGFLRSPRVVSLPQMDAAQRLIGVGGLSRRALVLAPEEGDGGAGAGSRDVPDGLTHGPVRGRGSAINPMNRFESVRVHADGEHLDEVLRSRSEAGEAHAAQQATQVFEDASRSILNHVDSPDLPFSWTINLYRGCEHGCIYCYARPGHEYLGLSSGLDFETKVFAKLRGPDLLREELSRPGWTGEPITMSGVTDCYQPVERELGLTRRCLEVMHEFGQPVSIITKNKLILRDVDILSAMARKNLVRVAISLTTLDPRLARAMEPRASSPRSRLDTIRTLARAGVPVMVMTAPIIPGLNDAEIPSLLREASRAGASSAGYVLLRLPHQIKDIFLDWLRREFPLRAAKVESLIRSTRAGGLYDSAWVSRGRGEGPLADQIAATMRLFRKRYRLDGPMQPLSREHFRTPAERQDAGAGQMRLW